MTVARGAAACGLALAIVLIAFVLLSGDSGHQYGLLFQNAGQLVNGDDVQVGGLRVGSVKSIELTPDNQAKITIDVTGDVAPLHQGTTAEIRASSLSGIANRYVALTPGANNLPRLRDGATLTADRTTSIVDLDQLFNTIDPRTRRSLQQVVQGSATQYAGEGANVNTASRYFNPVVGSTTRVLSELVRDQKVFTDFLISSSRTVTALAERGPRLTELVSHANGTFGAIGAENVSLSDALSLLPLTLRRADSTFVNLRATLGDLTTLVDVSKPATRRLAPFLADLRPLVASARPTIRDLRLLLTRPGPNNDLTDILNKLPGFERILRPSAAHTVTALRRSEPVLQFIRPYAPELEGWFRDFGQGANSYDANGHYARIQPIFGAFQFADNPLGGVLKAIDPQNRLTGLARDNTKRCPGGATQAPVDGSAPYAPNGLDCNPTQIPPGP